MSYLKLAARIQEALNIANARELEKAVPQRYKDASEDTMEYQQKAMHDITLHRDRAETFVSALNHIKDKLEISLKKDCQNLPNNFNHLLDSICNILVQRFESDFQLLPDCIKNSLDDLIEKLETGIIAGVRIIEKTLNAVARKILQEDGEISKEKFLEKARQSYEFVEELTRLTTGSITSIERFLQGVNLAPSILTFPQKIIDQFIAINESDLEELYQTSIQIQNDLNTFFTHQSKGDRRFDIDKLFFHPKGSITMTDEAIDDFIKQYNTYLGKFTKCQHAAVDALAGHPEGITFQDSTNNCPARDVAVENLDPRDKRKNKSLTEATYDFFIRHLENMPDLDQVLKNFVNHA